MNKLILMKFSLAFVTIIISSIQLVAQETIPFRLTKHNNLIIQTLINEKDTLDLMFQISMNDAALSPNRIRHANSIQFENEISDNNSIQIGNLQWENIRFFDNEYSGHESDGKIGKVLFQNKIFGIDYDQNQFVIYNELPNLTDYQEIPLLTDGEFFLISADSIFDWQPTELYFLLQSGFSGAIMYSNEVAKTNQLNQVLTIYKEQEYSDSQGNKIISKQAILPYFHFANTVLKDVKVGFFKGEARVQTQNYFGADLMKRFNWIFDVKNEKAYIKPSKYLRDKYYENEQ